MKVLLTGDSVSANLAGTLDELLRRRFDWRMRSVAVPVCPVYGEALAWPDGTAKENAKTCPETVIPAQEAAVRAFDPDLVIWWDRLSTMPFLTRDGAFVRAGSRRFWRLRAIAFDETLARLTAGGARIVFVATEPMGIGANDVCPRWASRACREWRRYRIEHYTDITQPENRILRRYAWEHPDEAVFISITDSICRRNVSPCDDRMPNGKLSRPDGTHYEGRGELLVAAALIRDLRAAADG
jgi:hypothetical protein